MRPPAFRPGRPTTADKQHDEIMEEMDTYLLSEYQLYQHAKPSQSLTSHNPNPHNVKRLFKANQPATLMHSLAKRPTHQTAVPTPKGQQSLPPLSHPVMNKGPLSLSKPAETVPRSNKHQLAPLLPVDAGTTALNTVQKVKTAAPSAPSPTHPLTTYYAGEPPDAQLTAKAKRLGLLDSDPSPPSSQHKLQPLAEGSRGNVVEISNLDSPMTRIRSSHKPLSPKASNAQHLQPLTSSHPPLARHITTEPNDSQNKVTTTTQQKTIWIQHLLTAASRTNPTSSPALYLLQVATSSPNILPLTSLAIVSTPKRRTQVPLTERKASQLSCKGNTPTQAPKTTTQRKVDSANDAVNQHTNTFESAERREEKPDFTTDNQNSSIFSSSRPSVAERREEEEPSVNGLVNNSGERREEQQHHHQFTVENKNSMESAERREEEDHPTKSNGEGGALDDTHNGADFSEERREGEDDDKNNMHREKKDQESATGLSPRERAIVEEAMSSTDPYNYLNLVHNLGTYKGPGSLFPFLSAVWTASQTQQQHQQQEVPLGEFPYLQMMVPLFHSLEEKEAHVVNSNNNPNIHQTIQHHTDLANQRNLLPSMWKVMIAGNLVRSNEPAKRRKQVPSVVGSHSRSHSPISHHLPKKLPSSNPSPPVEGPVPNQPLVADHPLVTLLASTNPGFPALHMLAKSITAVTPTATNNTTTTSIVTLMHSTNPELESVSLLAQALVGGDRTSKPHSATRRTRVPTVECKTVATRRTRVPTVERKPHISPITSQSHKHNLTLDNQSLQQSNSNTPVIPSVVRVDASPTSSSLSSDCSSTVTTTTATVTALGQLFNVVNAANHDPQTPFNNLHSLQLAALFEQDLAIEHPNIGKLAIATLSSTAQQNNTTTTSTNNGTPQHHDQLGDDPPNSRSGIMMLLCATRMTPTV